MERHEKENAVHNTFRGHMHDILTESKTKFGIDIKHPSLFILISNTVTVERSIFTVFTLCRIDCDISKFKFGMHRAICLLYIVDVATIFNRAIVRIRIM